MRPVERWAVLAFVVGVLVIVDPGLASIALLAFAGGIAWGGSL